MQRESRPLLAIVGPTASGKTACAISVAERFDGEIVSVDSRYLYRGLDIGTAKPDELERRRVPHHLMDHLHPTEDYSLALYQRDAYQVIDDILMRQRLPVLAGGTPLYINAVLEGWRIPEVSPNWEFREALQKWIIEHGEEALHRRLQEVDPVAAERIPPANSRRVIRALEIHNATGQRMSDLEGKVPPPYSILKIGLRIERERLKERINQRVEQMIASGFRDEIVQLMAAGITEDAPAMNAIGYREMMQHIRGELTLAETIDLIQRATHRYARHQLTWLRRMPDVCWVDAESDHIINEIIQRVNSWLRNETNRSPLT